MITDNVWKKYYSIPLCDHDVVYQCLVDDLDDAD